MIGRYPVGDPRRKLRPDIVEDDSLIPMENITSTIQLIDLIEREGDYTAHEAEVMKTTYETLRVIGSTVLACLVLSMLALTLVLLLLVIVES